MGEHRSERTIRVGAYVAMAGGSLLILNYFIGRPAVAPVGAILFVSGIVLVGVGGGLRNAWRAFWTFFP